MDRIKYSHLSFIGRRNNNQDNSIVLEISNSVFFLAVADGMGGAVGGQLASKSVLDTAFYILQDEFSGKVLPSDLKSILERIFIECQWSIAKRIKSEPELNGMGTTLTCVLVLDDKFVWGNIGDSRTYLMRGNNLSLITVDHTYIQDFIKEEGEVLSAHLLKQFSNYLQKAIDGGNDSADIFPQDKEFDTLADGDVFLLCSDGLITDKVSKETSILKNIISGSKTLKTAAEQLIAYAFANGSKDNISVVLAEYGNRKREKLMYKKLRYPPVMPELKRKGRVFIALNIIAMIIIACAVILAVVMLNSNKTDEIKNSEKANIDVLKIAETQNKQEQKKQSIIVDEAGNKLNKNNLNVEKAETAKIIKKPEQNSKTEGKSKISGESLPLKIKQDNMGNVKPIEFEKTLKKDKLAMELIKKGDEYFENKQFEKALNSYLRAKEILPNYRNLLSKIDLARNRIKK